MLDYEALEATHSAVNCDVTQKPISGPVRYVAVSKINGDELSVNLSENAFLNPSIYDLNPLIYYRLRRPLKEDAELPLLDPAIFYKESADYGIEI